MRRSLSPWILGACFIGAVALLAPPVFAQTSTAVDLEAFAQQAGFATGVDITIVIARLIRTFISILGIVAVVFILYGGWLWMTSKGEPEKLRKAQQTIINAIIGLVLVLSSFAIAQFVLNSLGDAANGPVIPPTDPVYPDDPDSDDADSFYLSSLNTDCAETVKNLALQFVFSSPVSSSTVEGGITVAIDGGDPIEGTFTTSGRRVTFRPDTPCAEDATEFCFDPMDYVVTVSPSVLRSTSGRELSCTTTYPCSYPFTVAEDAGVDTSGPTLTMDVPEDESYVYDGGENELLQVEAVDDVGVSSAEFYVEGENVYTSGWTMSLAEGVASTNYFFTDISQEWDTAGYVTNHYYDIWSVGADCAGNEDTSDRVTVRLYASTCENGILDEAYESEVDCGGESSSPYYCGACEGDTCTTDADCSGGAYCDAETGTCVSTPTIDRVSPGDGAEGNLITISGSGFGTASGIITFFGTESGDEKETSAYVCGGITSWSATQIVVQVPDGAVDGPLAVTTMDALGAEDEIDRTDDEQGPSIADFDVNAIVRPGLCSIAPNPTEALTSVTLSGLHFGSTQGTSAFYFDTYPPREYTSWSDAAIVAVVPLLNDGDYNTQVFAGDYYCEHSGTTCVTDANCDTGISEGCISRQCSETLAACRTDEECGEEGGTCEPIRQGSNELDFTVATVTETSPVISYVDTGWTACVGGANDGLYCTDSLEDCGTGSCEDKMNWGPSGQYVTIYGTDFGDTEGSVYFFDRTEGDHADWEVLGNADFPEACGGEYWNDTTITVKVPEEYEVGSEPLAMGNFDVYVKRHDLVSSNTVDFVVVSGEPGPAICSVNPDSGPTGTSVNFVGENLGNLDGTVKFYEEQYVDNTVYTSWNVDEILGVAVPVSAQTGPVSAITQEGGQSNSLNFTVGDCREDGALCDMTETCCGDGSCAASITSCPSDATVDAHYAFKFTTKTIPNTPEVRRICSSDEHIVSPTPWEGWSQPETVCLNALMSATFTIGMNASSLNAANIFVEKCVGTGDVVCDDVESVDLGSTITHFPYGFTLSHTRDFEPSTTYQVTLKGGDAAGRIQAHEREGGGYLAEDYIWKFTTSASSEPCQVGDVYVAPSTYTATEIEIIPYLAQLISQGDACVLVSCEDYTLSWDSTVSAALIGTPATVTGSCAQTVTPQFETAPGTPAIIEATVTDDEGLPSGTGELIINFGDPEITGKAPDCNTACVNPAIYAEFSKEMETDYFSVDHIKLYACDDALCAEGEMMEKTVTVTTVSSTKVSLVLPVASPLSADTYYRVWIDGDIPSALGISLSDSGSNFGEEENLFFEDDYSWIFKTKTSSAYCSIDRIDIDPVEAIATQIGQRQSFEAIPYGAPDDCSLAGQALQSGYYTWSPWTSSDTAVATMLDGGSILLSSTIPSWCTADCLNAGSTIQYDDAVCGDGDVDAGEECDGESSCSSDCLWEGTEGCPTTCSASGVNCTAADDCTTHTCSVSGATCTPDTAATVCTGTGETCVEHTDTCVVSGTFCCGNSIKETGEDCDDGDQTDGGGCSASCLNEGSAAAHVTCGGSLDFTSTIGGEDCDDGNTTSGDGCSSQCLNEGSIALADVVAICGNGGSPEDGEDCDDGNLTNGDGCSSSCLFEGANACVYACFDGTSFGVNCSSDWDCVTGTCEAVETPCCGDRITDYNGDGYNEAENCDDGYALGGDGCSALCLQEGSSIAYGTPSYCGDGAVETGEECDADASGTFTTSAYGVAEIEETAPASLDPETHLAFSVVATSADGQTGEGNYGVQCSCEEDQACGNTTTYGCGTGGCCFERMISGAYYPTGTDVCRNSAVWVEFSQNVDLASLNPSTDNDGDGIIETDEYQPTLYLEYTGDTCPAGYYAYADAVPHNIFVRAWQWVVRTVSSWFGSEAQALSGVCAVPVTYHVSVIEEGRYRVYLDYTDLLESGTYQVAVVGDSSIDDEVREGVLSANGVGLATASFTTPTFTIGSEICGVDEVVVEDTGDVTAASYEDASAQYFSEIGEEHLFTAAAYSVRSGTPQEIVSTSAYSWTWGWANSDTTSTILTVTQDATETNEASAVAVGQNGNVTAIAQATIITDTGGDSEGRAVSGLLPVQVFLCENPWISSGSSIYEDPTMNFSFTYCRDYGEEGTDDDLPRIGDSDGDPTQTVSLTSDTILKELVFHVDGTRDAIGFRVVQNESYLSPEDWYAAQEFGGSLSPTMVDGYEAGTEGTTTYVLAANQSGTTIYPNIYVVSYNENASEESQEIFNRILESLSFNANEDVVSDINLCSVTSGTYVQKTDGNYVSCAWDGDCLETCATQGDGSQTCSITGNECTSDADCGLAASKSPFCDAKKAKLRRDTQRVRDVAAMEETLVTYGEENKHCEVTTDQACSADSDCPGTESCFSEVATVTTGSFIPSYTVSTWPSWNAGLSNMIGEALPTDPVNDFYNCSTDGYDDVSCWNGDVGLFMCPALSHVYAYRSVGGLSYKLYAQLEYNGGAWAYDIDTDATDQATISVEYESGTGKSYSGTVQDGFVVASTFCTGGTLGTSLICGDGIIDGTTEECEIGDTTAIPCDSSTGLINAACKSDCSGYQTEGEAELAGAVCSPYTCGNGVVEGTEICDDGEENGTYGHCGDLCTTSDGFYCGDGYLAGGEQCDCGNTSTWSTVMGAGSTSWALAHCDTTPGNVSSNGQYVSSIAQSCEFDCTYPGPSCGDGVINGSEACDGDYVEWEGALCSDGSTVCEDDSDCSTGTCGPTTGLACGEDADGYQMYRYRSCGTTCGWGTWSSCVAGDQQCGNGILEGDEVCDDGNDSNNDACLNTTCELNVCGDSFVYTGIESCDRGTSNGSVCSASYDSTCQYCTTTCEYMTRSGSYCGDALINGDEYCDGATTPYYYFDATLREIGTSCDASGVGVSASVYTCRKVGVCNGGGDNGEYCTINNSADGYHYGDDQACADAAVCEPFVCASDCQTSCPFTYESSSLQIQSEVAGSSPQSSLELYSYLSGGTPDNATVILPGCSIGRSLTADIDMSGVAPPDMDIVFVTDCSGSMGTNMTDEGDYYIDIASEVLSTSISELFDFYAAEPSSTLQIGLVSFSTAFSTSASMDSALTGEEDEDFLLSIAAGYATCAEGEGNTPTFVGMVEAVNLFYDSSADIKIIVLLSDGFPNYHYNSALEVVSCYPDFLYTYEEIDYSIFKACVVEIKDYLETYASSYDIYTATIGSSSSSYVGYAAHISDEECTWTDSLSVDECTLGSYAFSGTTSDEIEAMYEAVIDSILGVKMTWITTSMGATITTTGSTGGGRSITLPFPDAFACESDTFTLPLRLEFDGEGTVELSNLQLQYCPLE